MRRAAALLLLALFGACEQAAPALVAPSLPPVPPAASGWTSIASVGGGGGPGFVGFTTEVNARPLALHVVCVGTGTLVVTISREGPLAAMGEDAVVFPCALDSTAGMRRDLRPEFEAGSLTISGAVVEGAGAIRATVFQVSLEQAAT